MGIPRDASRVLQRIHLHYLERMNPDIRLHYQNLMLVLSCTSIEEVPAGRNDLNIGNPQDILVYADGRFILMRSYHFIQFFFAYDIAERVCTCNLCGASFSWAGTWLTQRCFPELIEHTRQSNCILMNLSCQVGYFDAANFLRSADLEILFRAYIRACPLTDLVPGYLPYSFESIRSRLGSDGRRDANNPSQPVIAYSIGQRTRNPHRFY